MDFGASRSSSWIVAAGMLSVSTSRIGPPSIAAAGPPAKASGKFVPTATAARGTPGANVAAEIAAAVANRSGPDRRTTSPVGGRSVPPAGSVPEANSSNTSAVACSATYTTIAPSLVESKSRMVPDPSCSLALAGPVTGTRYRPLAPAYRMLAPSSAKAQPPSGVAILTAVEDPFTQLLRPAIRPRCDEERTRTVRRGVEDVFADEAVITESTVELDAAGCGTGDRDAVHRTGVVNRDGSQPIQHVLGVPGDRDVPNALLVPEWLVQPDHPLLDPPLGTLNRSW